MTFKAMVLDERDVLRGVVELDYDSQLTARHVDLRPHGGECDRMPGEYRWDRLQKQLVPLPRQQRAVEARPSLEHAVAFWLLKDCANRPGFETSLAVELQWLDDMLRSVDFAEFKSLPSVQAYAAARGISLTRGD